MKLPFKEKKGYWTSYFGDNHGPFLENLMLDCPSENCIVIGKRLSSPTYPRCN